MGISVKAGEDYTLKLLQVEEKTLEIAGRALYAGADILIDEVRKNLEANINDPESAAKHGGALFKRPYTPTGSLSRTLGIAHMDTDKNGVINVKIGFDGYDPRGVPNQLKARVMESGSSTIKKRPFVRPAVKAAKKRVVQKMDETINQEIEKIMKG